MASLLGKPTASPYGGQSGTQSTRTDLAPKNQFSAERQQCTAKGGTWDEKTNSCRLPAGASTLVVADSQKTQPASVATSGTDAAKGTGNNIDTTFNPDGSVTRTVNGVTNHFSRDEYEAFLSGTSATNSGAPKNFSAGVQQAIMAERSRVPAVDAAAKTDEQKAFEAEQYATSPEGIQAQQLQGQVGQFDQLPVSPTDISQGDIVKQGLINAIPKALGLAAAGAGAGFLTGGAAGTAVAPVVGTGIGAVGGALIGGISGLVAGLSRGMISEYEKQRTDSVNAQKNVLNEGKQTLKDWATLAEADPANRAFYLSQYNKVSAQIDKAYRQLKLDTSRDLGSFEKATQELAEFEAYYAQGGEKDVLDLEMRNSLLVPSSPEYKMLELVHRRQGNV